VPLKEKDKKRLEDRRNKKLTLNESKEQMKKKMRKMAIVSYIL
jgi:hypothetical protein